MSNISNISNIQNKTIHGLFAAHGIEFDPTQQFFVMAGPCVIESEEHCLAMCDRLSQICAELGVPYVFKASFDKANRTSIDSYRGPGLERGLEILKAVKDRFGCPIITDIHEPDQCAVAAEVADILQVPAFLCRQTDLLVAVAKTGAVVNIKKGQFCSPSTMTHAIGKIRAVNPGAEIMLCDRGTMFGYGDLIVDFRNLAQMRQDHAKTGCLIVQDITHALQQPNVAGTTQGCRELIPTIARCAVAAGVEGIFMEVHDHPEQALSDKTTQWPLEHFRGLVSELLEIHRVTRGRQTNYLD